MTNDTKAGLALAALDDITARTFAGEPDDDGKVVYEVDTRLFSEAPLLLALARAAVVERVVEDQYAGPGGFEETWLAYQRATKARQVATDALIAALAGEVDDGE